MITWRLYPLKKPNGNIVHEKGYNRYYVNITVDNEKYVASVAVEHNDVRNKRLKRYVYDLGDNHALSLHGITKEIEIDDCYLPYRFRKSLGISFEDYELTIGKIVDMCKMHFINYELPLEVA